VTPDASPIYLPRRVCAGAGSYGTLPSRSPGPLPNALVSVSSLGSQPAAVTLQVAVKRVAQLGGRGRQGKGNNPTLG